MINSTAAVFHHNSMSAEFQSQHKFIGLVFNDKCEYVICSMLGGGLILRGMTIENLRCHEGDLEKK